MSLTIGEKWKMDTNIVHNQAIKDMLYPAIYGGIIGDALGVPYEFKERGAFTVTEMSGFGTHGQKAGTWSDDTSLTLCLMETLIEHKGTDGLMEKMLQYQNSGYWTPYGKAFDIGLTTQKALSLYEKGTPAEKCGMTSEENNGNGALMRIAPLVFTFVDDFDFSLPVKAVEKYATITHAHPRSTLGCIIYLEFLFRLCHFDNFDDALKYTVELCKKNLCNTVYEPEFISYHRIFNKEIKNLPVDEIYSDGYIVNTLESALWCFANNGNFKDTVIAAVNLGGDTDTIAAIAGTMAGLYYKMDGIPKTWIDMLARKDDLAALLLQFRDYCAGGKN